MQPESRERRGNPNATAFAVGVGSSITAALLVNALMPRTPLPLQILSTAAESKAVRQAAGNAWRKFRGLKLPFRGK